MSLVNGQHFRSTAVALIKLPVVWPSHIPSCISTTSRRTSAWETSFLRHHTDPIKRKEGSFPLKPPLWYRRANKEEPSSGPHYDARRDPIGQPATKVASHVATWCIVAVISRTVTSMTLHFSESGLTLKNESNIDDFSESGLTLASTEAKVKPDFEWISLVTSERSGRAKLPPEFSRVYQKMF